jgi:hypothetical protein
MTPDTSAFMVAGFTVILSGIVIYILSLTIRLKNVRRQINYLDVNKKEIE